MKMVVVGRGRLWGKDAYRGDLGRQAIAFLGEEGVFFML